MKTTIDLPNDLLIEAKAVAARRRTTLKAVVEHALRREIAPAVDLKAKGADLFETGPYGILRLRKRGTTVTSETVYQLVEAAEEEDLRDALAMRAGKEP